jgi:hypothetical protein
MLSKGTCNDHTGLFVAHAVEKVDAFITVGKYTNGINDTSKFANSVATIGAGFVDVIVQPNQKDILHHWTIDSATWS